MNKLTTLSYLLMRGALRNATLKSVPGRVVLDDDYERILRHTDSTVVASLSQQWSIACATIQEGIKGRNEEMILKGFNLFEAQADWIPVVDFLQKKYQFQRDYPTIRSFTELMANCLRQENFEIRKRAFQSYHRMISDCGGALKYIKSSLAQDKTSRFSRNCYLENENSIREELEHAKEVFKESIRTESDFEVLREVWWSLQWGGLDPEFLVQLAETQLEQYPDLVNTRLTYVLDNLLPRVEASIANRVATKVIDLINEGRGEQFLHCRERFAQFQNPAQ